MHNTAARINSLIPLVWFLFQIPLSFFFLSKPGLLMFCSIRDMDTPSQGRRYHATEKTSTGVLLPLRHMWLWVTCIWAGGDAAVCPESLDSAAPCWLHGTCVHSEAWGQFKGCDTHTPPEEYVMTKRDSNYHPGRQKDQIEPKEASLVHSGIAALLSSYNTAARGFHYSMSVSLDFGLWCVSIL